MACRMTDRMSPKVGKAPHTVVAANTGVALVTDARVAVTNAHHDQNNES
jgi:hypothetical protein